MQYKKQIIGTLEKCYSLSPINAAGQACFLVAAEKHAPCYLFDLAGNLLDEVWKEPGGVMTMVPVPGREETFLATHQFYSPNDSKDAKLVCARKIGETWKITTIAEMPFVHRFDIIPAGGVNYVLACTLKSGHEYKNDWRSPGKLYMGVLGENPEKPVQFSPLLDGLGHNHGYTRYVENGKISGIVSCDQGVFRVTPPETSARSWNVRQLTNQPASDAVLIDLDGDGQPELLTISPFHGDTVTIWHRDGETYVPVYEYPEKLPFLHAICGGTVYDRPTVYVGNREGERLLLGFWWDPDSGRYQAETVDRDAGPANCMLFERDGHPALLAANRETNEIAVYDILPDRGKCD